MPHVFSGGDQDIAAVAAAVAEGSRFMVEGSDVQRTVVSLGENAKVFRCSVNTPGRKMPTDGSSSPDGLTKAHGPPVPACTREPFCFTISSVTEDIVTMSKPADLVQGTLDLLLLKILALEPRHGWAISQRLKQVSANVLQVSDGSLYPALHKLEQEGWITAEWKTSELGRRAKFYSLTRLGRKQLEKQVADWTRLSSAISDIVQLEQA